MRWRQDRHTGEMIPVDAEAAKQSPQAPAVHGDIEPFISPVDQTVIGSRRALREHNERNQVQQHREYGDGEGVQYLKDREKERHDRLTGNTPKDRAERLASIIPIVEKAET